MFTTKQQQQQQQQQQQRQRQQQQQQQDEIHGHCSKEEKTAVAAAVKNESLQVDKTKAVTEKTNEKNVTMTDNDDATNEGKKGESVLEEIAKDTTRPVATTKDDGAKDEGKKEESATENTAKNEITRHKTDKDARDKKEQAMEEITKSELDMTKLEAAKDKGKIEPATKEITETDTAKNGAAKKEDKVDKTKSSEEITNEDKPATSKSEAAKDKRKSAAEKDTKSAIKGDTTKEKKRETAKGGKKAENKTKKKDRPKAKGDAANEGKKKPAVKKAPSKKDDETAEVDFMEDLNKVCCCLCYCSVDFADPEYFSQEARDKAAATDGCVDASLPKKLLPMGLHDTTNALVFCDTCNRPYHQRCHFVPVISLPRGDWHCFLCTSSGAAKKRRTKKKTNPLLYPAGKPSLDHGTKRWERETRVAKANAFAAEMRRLQSGLSQQLQNIRMAQTTLLAYTSKSSSSGASSNVINRPLKVLLKSQELCQTVVRLTGSKLRIRQWLKSLYAYLKGDEETWGALGRFLQENPDQIATWFPYGRPRPDYNVGNTDVPLRRVVPRFIPTRPTCGVPEQVVARNDDDSGISLDDLCCCVCLDDETTDENDLILCDGKDCFRAYHYRCLVPPLTAQQAEATPDWFCPLCTAVAKLLSHVQSEYNGVFDDDDDNDHDDDDKSGNSWQHVDEVFPEAPRHHQLALNWKEGKLNEDTKKFVSHMFGVAMRNDDYNDDDDDDEEEDEDFDLHDFFEKREEEESVGSSQATLAEMSSVELEIPQDELDALSDQEDEPQPRVKQKDDPGRLDADNILPGKRKRHKVDYRRLNDSLFGALTEQEVIKIDDKDDAFELKRSGSFSSDDEKPLRQVLVKNGKNGTSNKKQNGKRRKTG